ncbi:maleylpyruvate isomerase family mycothiol-dependent enzyme [Nocardia sp. NBC_01327]|uniref:maleylpyruvate isomerase family mycothiol-dependent enzyme n=1 Tax=Nocardia sp. NBC_01327 TaxID=2903593 RepID=UPI002E12100A|nr:maleylpyruvate isomerase family mycothiol-dependent enzyme [Nocardia sp. NBC_01327]
MSSDALAALRTERETLLGFCRDLTDAEWATPSLAEGWRVQDVVAHMTALSRALITPAAITSMLSRDIEQSNNAPVDKARSQSPRQVLDGFEAWSRRGITALRAFTLPGVRRIPLPVAEIGTYPLRIFPSLFLFDWHTHLRHDIAPALGRPAPDTDAPRMAAILAWLMTLLEQSQRTRLNWLDAPLTLTLDGPGGGTWRIEPATGGRLRVRPGAPGGAAAHITARALEFPQWSTTRRPWTESDVTLTGNTDLATHFLNSLNLV